uniref:Coluporin-1 n=1 Tax=Colubraria reticulata TaxID=604273 RepID=A0A499RUF9_9CAEN|nr:coluporin-1 [Colubraria reticulata]
MVFQFPRLKTLLMTFLFVIGHEPQPVQMTDFDTVKSAASTVVTEGTSFGEFAEKNLKQLGYKVNVVMTVENWSRFPLNSRNFHVQSGHLFYGAKIDTIAPCKKEVLALRNGEFVGSYGTVSFLVSGASRRFVIMWSAPYVIAAGGYKNWMGLGLTRKGYTDKSSEDLYYDRMYRESNTADLMFNRKEFYYDVNPVTMSDDQFETWATMATGNMADIRVIFKPVNDGDLAPQLRQALGLSG